MQVRLHFWHRSARDVSMGSIPVVMIRYRDRLPQLALGPRKAVPRPQAVVRPEVLRRARFSTVYPPGDPPPFSSSVHPLSAYEYMPLLVPHTMCDRKRRRSNVATPLSR